MAIDKSKLTKEEIWKIESNEIAKKLGNKIPFPEMEKEEDD